MISRAEATYQQPPAGAAARLSAGSERPMTSADRAAMRRARSADIAFHPVSPLMSTTTCEVGVRGTYATPVRTSGSAMRFSSHVAGCPAVDRVWAAPFRAVKAIAMAAMRTGRLAGRMDAIKTPSGAGGPGRDRGPAGAY